jgi:hypothetical protein
MRMKRYLILLSVSILLAFGLLGEARGQSADSTEAIPVQLTVRGVGKAELIVYAQGNTVFVPVVELFTFLRLNATFNPQNRSVEGFYITPDSKYIVDGANRTASVRDRVVALGAGDFLVRGTDVYLRAELYDQLFALQLTYFPRRLEIVLKTKENLPVFLERARELARRRKGELFAVPTAEYTAPRKVSLFSLGRLDYLFSNQLSRYGSPRQSYSLHLGNQLLGGDFDGRVNGTVRTPLTSRDATARLRYAFLSNSYVRQIYLGDVFTGGLVPSSVWGAEITNRPAPRRYLFGTEDLDGTLQTGGVADFYFRGVLSDYQKGDADGNYSFTTPLIYGASNYEVKQYDAYGIERQIEYRIIVPPTMLPTGEVQYSLVGGKLRYLDNQFYGNGSVQWGVNPYLTLGTGFDIYDGTNPYSGRTVHPFFTTTGRLTQTLIGDFTVAPTAYSRGVLSLTYPSSAGGTISYAWYNRNPFYNPRSIKTDGAATVSIPIRSNLQRLNLDLLVRETIFESGRDRILQASLGGQFGALSPRLTHRRTWRDRDFYHDIEAYTTASVGFRASGGFFFRGQTRYYHYGGGFRDLRLEFSRRFTKEFWLQIFFDKSFLTQSAIAGVQLVYYFPFTLLRTIVSGGGATGIRTSESVSGSFGYSAEVGEFYFDYLSNRVGFGGILVNPFVDVNNNGIHDEGEESLEKAKISASTMFGNQPLKYIPGSGFGLKHTLPYEEYIMTIDPEYFDNPLWIPKYTSIAVVSEPNMFREVDLPIVFGGIIRGRVEGGTATNVIPLEGVTVTLQTDAPEEGKEPYKKVGISFSTGEFEFIGVPPGRYRISVDNAQIGLLGYRTTEPVKTLEVVSKPDGDEINDVNFILSR